MSGKYENRQKERIINKTSGKLAKKQDSSRLRRQSIARQIDLKRQKCAILDGPVFLLGIFPPGVSARRFRPAFPPGVSARRFRPAFPSGVSTRHLSAHCHSARCQSNRNLFYQ